MSTLDSVKSSRFESSLVGDEELPAKIGAFAKIWKSEWLMYCKLLLQPGALRTD